VIFRFFSGLAVRFWLVLGIIIPAWNIIIHVAQPPLPRLFFGNIGTQALYMWTADCPSPLETCQRERMVLEGLNLHPVAQPSPDGEYIAVYMAEAWMIYPADCLLGDQDCTPIPLDATANDTRVAWGPDGSTIAYMTSVSNTTMKIRTKGCWDGSPARACLTYTVQLASDGVLRQPTWSANGERLAFLGLQPRGLFVLDAACLSEPASCIDQLQLVEVSLSPAYWPSLSADGGELLFFAETPYSLELEQVYRVQIQSGAVEQISFQRGGGSVPSWSSDERYIAYAGFHNRSSGDLEIYILDRDRQITALAIHHPGQDLTYPAWNP